MSGIKDWFKNGDPICIWFMAVMMLNCSIQDHGHRLIATIILTSSVPFLSMGSFFSGKVAAYSETLPKSKQP